MSLKEDVYSYISTGNLTMREVAELLDADYNNVTRIVRSLKNEGRIVETSPRPTDPKTTKRFRAADIETLQLIMGKSPDRIVMDAFKYIEENHPDELYDKDDLNAKFERAVSMIMRFPEIADHAKRKTNALQAKSKIMEVAREFERALKILYDMMGIDLVNPESYPLLRSTESRALARMIDERVKAVKNKEVEVTGG